MKRLTNSSRNMNSTDFRIITETACVTDMLAYMTTYDVCVETM